MRTKRASLTVWGIFVLGISVLYLPLAVMVLDSFQRSAVHPEWTFDWYTRVFQNADVMKAVVRSFWIALATMVISTVLGVAAAYGLERAQFRGKAWIESALAIPLVMPEIVLGIALLTWFVMLRLSLGMVSVVLAHVTFSISYVVLGVQARLREFDRSLEDAARDLGASEAQVFRRVTLPLLMPAIVSGAVMAFTLSFDDFLLTFFVSGVGSDTLPVKIYAMIKYGVSREINALSTLLLGVTLILILSFSQGFFRPQKKRG